MGIVLLHYFLQLETYFAPHVLLTLVIHKLRSKSKINHFKIICGQTLFEVIFALFTTHVSSEYVEIFQPWIEQELRYFVI